MQQQAISSFLLDLAMASKYALGPCYVQSIHALANASETVVRSFS
jgi:hypothetical protein